MERDFYQVLGVARTATQREIRATYVRLVKHHHPDSTGSLPSRLRDIQHAYRCLADPALRAAHDQRITDGERAHHARQRSIQRRLNRYDGRHPPPRPQRRRRWRTMLIVAIGVGVVARAFFI